MKRHPLVLIMLVAVTIVSLYACKKKDAPVGPTGPQGPTGEAGAFGFSGVIAGHVSLYDQNGAQKLNHLNGVKVSLNDSVSTLTDSMGGYLFANVTTGNYNIKASNTNYGNTQTGNFAFLKDTLYKDLHITQLPDSNVTQLNINRVIGFEDDVHIWISPFSAPRILFISKSPNVSSSNYMMYYISNQIIRIPLNDYVKAGIFYGDTVYYAAYSYVKKDFSSYIDDKTGMTIFTAIGSKAAYDTLTAP